MGGPHVWLPGRKWERPAKFSDHTLSAQGVCRKCNRPYRWRIGLPLEWFRSGWRLTADEAQARAQAIARFESYAEASVCYLCMPDEHRRELQRYKRWSEMG